MFHACFVCKYYWAIKYVKTNVVYQATSVAKWRWGTCNI